MATRAERKKGSQSKASGSVAWVWETAVAAYTYRVANLPQ